MLHVILLQHFACIKILAIALMNSLLPKPHEILITHAKTSSPNKTQEFTQ